MVLKNGKVLHFVITGCQLQHAIHLTNVLPRGNSPLGIVEEGIPFPGIPNDDNLQSTVACTISEGYNPTSTKGMLKAVKVNDKVELSPDGESDRADGSKFFYNIFSVSGAT